MATNCVGYAHWHACEDCIHSDDGQPCDRDDFTIEDERVLCDSHRTAEDEQQRRAELRGDCARAE